MLPEIFSTLRDHGYEMVGRLAEGGFSTVYTVTWDKYPGQVFVAKVISLGNGDDEVKYITYINEINSLKALSHQNIIYIFNHFKTEDKLYIILEYCPYGSLMQQIYKNGPLSAHEFKRVAKQCLIAINCCHQNGIVHLDLKPQNVLLDEDFKVKLCDFGLAGFDKQEDTTFWTDHGTYYFYSPERFESKPFDPKKADIWALGVTFYCFVTGTMPWFVNNLAELKEKISTTPPPFSSKYDDKTIQLISSMIQVDPSRRPSAEELLKFPLFKDDNRAIFFQPKENNRRLIIKAVLSKDSIFPDKTPGKNRRILNCHSICSKTNLLLGTRLSRSKPLFSQFQPI